MWQYRSKLKIGELNRQECLDLLKGQEVGRLGVVVAGKPEIFPVNYAIDAAGAIVFETVPGMKLAAAVNHHVVFEIDQIQEPDSAWSIVVHGVAHQTDSKSLRFEGRRPKSWILGRSATIRINPDRVTGRRLCPETQS